VPGVADAGAVDAAPVGAAGVEDAEPIFIYIVCVLYILMIL